MDKEIENMVRNCDVCLEVAQNPHKTLLHPWEKSGKPWKRMHVDHVGPIMDHMFFLIADSYTKWIDACPVSSTSTELVVEKLSQSFSIQGLSVVIVSDNATCFTSQEFANFVKKMVSDTLPVRLITLPVMALQNVRYKLSKEL